MKPPAYSLSMYCVFCHAIEVHHLNPDSDSTRDCYKCGRCQYVVYLDKPKPPKTKTRTQPFNTELFK